MKPPNTSVRFFGLNLRQLKHDWTIALNQIAHWPVLRWLAPAYVTRITIANGETADYVEKTGRALVKQQETKKVKFFGFLLPDKLVLWHPMVLPKLSADAVHAAIELEVMSLSPFLSDDVVWGHTPLISAQQGNKTHIVIASRKIILQYIASLEPTKSSHDSFEIWVKPPQGHGFLVLDGFGEKKRKRLTVRWRIVNLYLVFLLAAIGLAAAVTPTAQLRLRALQAAQDYEKLRPLAAPAIKQRELLVQLDQQIKVLQVQQEKSLKPELALLRITKLLPDDTYVTSLQVQGSKILLTGQTANTAVLMQQLGAQTGVKDVRAPTAAGKQRGAERETFNIEFTLDPSSLIAQP